jgi:hypothetical protein
VNGSALLLVEPVGISQLQDCSFENNQQREGAHWVALYGESCLPANVQQWQQAAVASLAERSF